MKIKPPDTLAQSRKREISRDEGKDRRRKQGKRERKGDNEKKHEFLVRNSTFDYVAPGEVERIYIGRVCLRHEVRNASLIERKHKRKVYIKLLNKFMNDFFSEK